MDTTRWFLQAVVPWDGHHVTIHWHRKGSKGLPGRSCQTIEDALQAVIDMNVDGVDVYFCLSTQRLNSGKRSRDNAVAVSSAWMDLDVDPDDDSKYGSVEEAIAALYNFCTLVGIPKPSLIVASGGGIHAYWFSEYVLTVAEWQPFADALKTAALAANLKFDAGVTSDVARVLRVPGTYNWKLDDPRPVRIIHGRGEQYDFETIFQPIFQQFPKTRPSKKMQVADALKHLGVQTHLAEGIVIKDAPLLPFEPIKQACGWLAEAHNTGGAKFDQTQWNYTTLIATFLQDGHTLAHEFGNQHPDYSVDTTDDIWERKNEERKTKNIGWPYCKTISQNGGKAHCEKCPLLAKGKSPLTVGFEAIKDNLVSQEVQELGATIPPELRLPEGYVVDEHGRICEFIQGKVVKGVVHQAQLTLLIKNVVREPSLQFQNGVIGLGFIATTDRKGESEVFLNVSNTLNINVLGSLLASKSVMINHIGKGNSDKVVKFASSWLDKLRLEDEAIRDSGTMGWRYQDGVMCGFVYGDILYRADGTEVPLIASTDDEFRSWYSPQGDKAAWLKACKLLTDRKRPELDCIIAIAFAAPLTAFAGTLYGAILSVWGEPGSSKSTAQQVASAVWGHPKQTRESLNSTPKSIQGRLGRTKNLAAYWDDIQDERHQLSLFDTMFVASEGTEGGRLHTDASYKVRLEWQTLLVACSNASFVEFLLKKQKSTTAGIRRVFEFECNRKYDEPGLINAHDASVAFAALEHNYGRIGAEYAKLLACNHVEINALVDRTMKGFMEEVEGNSDENFWYGVCGTLLVGATLACRMGAELDVPAMREFLVESYIQNRKIRGQEGTEGGSYANTEIALTSFLNHFIGSGNALWVNKVFQHRKQSLTPLKSPEHGHPIYVQIARDSHTIAISKKALTDYLHKNGIHGRQVFNGLKKFFRARETRITLGAGTTHAQTQELCYEIIVPAGEHILREALCACGEPQ